MIEQVEFGGFNIKIPFEHLVNLYGCSIGDYSFVGPFVEIQRGVQVGQFAKIESHTFICEGVTIGDRCFIGHGVTFCNDLFPAIDAAPVRLHQTLVGNDVVIGSGATILPCRIGDGVVIGAGAVVVDPAPPWSVIVGNPGRIVAGFPGKLERDQYFATRQRNYLLAIQR
jgi:UDP-2-acetamido-3-amino-2,3-dideoxy-glucuronate N-acetyltransferase